LAEHEDLVRQLVAEQPDVTLAELGMRLAKKKITASKSSISRFLHHLQLRFKKSMRAAEQDRPDIAAARRALRRRQTILDGPRCRACQFAHSRMQNPQTSNAIRS
jgi:transposase